MTDRSNYPADVLRRALVTWKGSDDRCECGAHLLSGTLAGADRPDRVACPECGFAKRLPLVVRMKGDR